jgi:two-component system copper resistance phosphate regulon response regulator CusR
MATVPITEQVLNAPQILVVEDDMPLASFIGERLQSELYSVELAHDGQVASDALNGSRYDLVILDLNLPSVDGITLLKQLRPAHPHLPVLVLTGRNRIEDRVSSLDAGADDCMNKPFSLLEFSARVRALLRRNYEPIEATSTVADLTIDRRNFRVERAGRRISLTSREFSLLEYLVRNARRPVSRAELMENVWNQPFDPSTNLVDVYVKYVRDKVDANSECKLIRTMRGIGYVLSDE